MAAPRGDLGKIIQKWGLLCGSDGKESAYNARDMGSIPRSRSFPGGEHGSPLLCSCLENPMDRGAWWATVRGVAESWTRLSDLSQHTACVMEELSHLRLSRKAGSEIF